MIALAVGNGVINDLHAGKWSPLLEDNTLSRITNPEMKAFMIDATKRLTQLLRMRDSDPAGYREYLRTVGAVHRRSPGVVRNKATNPVIHGPSDEHDELYPGGFNHRDEANALIAFAVRNGPIEDLHAGKYSPLVEDRTLSRITDTELNAIMINAIEHLAKLLRMRDSDPVGYRAFVRTFGSQYCWSWEREK